MLGMDVLAKGLFVGFAVAAPVGPIGLLCIRKTLTKGAAAGLASGFGAATGDAFYGLLAATGFALTGILLSHATFMSMAGGLLLCALGLNTFRKTPLPCVDRQSLNAESRGTFGAFVSTFALTLANPMTILAFIAMITALGVTADAIAAGPYLLVLGVFLGSAIWWLGLVHATLFMRVRITPSIMRGIDLVSGVLLIGWGLFIIFGNERLLKIWESA